MVSHSVMKGERIIPPKSTASISIRKVADEVGADKGNKSYINLEYSAAGPYRKALFFSL